VRVFDYDWTFPDDPESAPQPPPQEDVMIFALTFLTAGLLAAPVPLTDADRTALVTELQASQQAVVDTIKGLTPEQMAFKPGPDRWSVAECVEHITNTEPFLFGFIQGKVLKTPPASEADRAKTAGKDAGIMETVTNRTKKFQAPAEIRPTGKITGRDDLLKAFGDARAKTLDWTKTTKDDLRAHVMAGPGGELDGFQWMMYLSGHTRRHLAQIKEVMSSPNFPK
jgi:hypothetical protein